MKCSARVKLAVVGAVLAAMFLAGSAWAGISDEVQAINAYGLTAHDLGGNTIEITGTKTDADHTLALGMFADSDITYRWNAVLKADCGTFPATSGNSNIYRHLIRLAQGPNLSFDIIGGEIGFTDSNNTRARDGDDEDYVNIIRADSPNVHITLDGGKVGTDMRDAGVIIARQNAVITLKKGEINAPYCGAVEASNGNFSLDQTALQNGTLKINGTVDPGQEIDGIVNIFAYGTARLDSATNMENLSLSEYYITVTENASFTLGLSIEFGLKTAMIVENDAVLTIDGVKIALKGEDSLLHVKKGGTLILVNGGIVDVSGEIIIDGTVRQSSASVRATLDSNNGVVDNRGTIVISSKGKLTNNGIIYNKNTGTITNRGKIDNINGEIYNNEGGVFESVQTASEMGGTINGEVQPLNNNTSSGGGGCNAGFGLFSPLLAGLVMCKSRKA